MGFQVNSCKQNSKVKALNHHFVSRLPLYKHNSFYKGLLFPKSLSLLASSYMGRNKSKWIGIPEVNIEILKKSENLTANSSKLFSNLLGIN